MTVSKTTSSATFFGNGSATSFSLGFYVAPTDTLRLYTVSGDGEFTTVLSGFSFAGDKIAETTELTFSVAPGSGTEFYAVRETQPSQLVSLTGQVSYSPTVVESVWDKLSRLIQELQNGTGKVLRSTTAISPIKLLAGRALMVNSDGTEIICGPTVDEVNAAASNAAAASASANAAAYAANSAEAARDVVQQLYDSITPYDSVAAVRATTIAASVTSLMTRGYETPGDNGAWPLAIRVASEPSHAGSVRSADRYLPDGTIDETFGGWWELITNEPAVEMFGVAEGLLPAAASINTARIANALNYCSVKKLGKLFALGNFYVFSGVGIRIPNGVKIVGSGCDTWDVIFPGRKKGWTGTTFVAYGTGTKVETAFGLTDRSVSGGWRSNGAYTYKLTNFMDANASGTSAATARAFSAFVAPLQRPTAADRDNYAYAWGIEGIRLVPWIGTDGISGYDNPATLSLGASWDIGFYAPDSKYEIFDGQAVGYWRIAGVAKIQAGFSQYGAGERGRYSGQCQGYRGLIVRGAELFYVVASTATTITIPWTTSSQFGATGSLEAAGGAEYSWTGITNNGNGTLTLTGVTPDASSIGVGTSLRPSKRGTGVAGTVFRDLLVHPLCHHSGAAATALGFSDPSIGLEIDGFPIRGLLFINTKVHSTSDEIAANTFIGNAADTMMLGCQFENGAVIATPYKSGQSWASYPVGGTTDLRLLHHVWSADKTLFTPRTYFDDGETFPSQSTSSTEDVLATQAGRTRVIKKQTNCPLQIQDGDGSVLAEFAAASGGLLLKDGRQFSLSGVAGYINVDSSANLYVRNGTITRLQLYGASGNFAPGSDNKQSWGVAALRWAQVYSGTATINTSDARDKQDIAELDDAEKRVALACKGLIRRFRFKDAVAQKGENARNHFGVIAQEITDAFAAEGLNAGDYGIVCYDEWDEMPEELDDEGNVVTQDIPAGNRYGIRYEELLTFIIAAL